MEVSEVVWRVGGGGGGAGDVAYVPPVEGRGTVRLPRGGGDVMVRKVGEVGGQDVEVSGAGDVSGGEVGAGRVGGAEKDEVERGAGASGKVELSVGAQEGGSGKIAGKAVAEEEGDVRELS